jgi:hypothetical protein
MPVSDFKAASMGELDAQLLGPNDRKRHNHKPKSVETGSRFHLGSPFAPSRGKLARFPNDCNGARLKLGSSLPQDGL